MEKATGQVESVHGGVATVVVAAPVACARCAAGKGCGAGLLTGPDVSRQVQVQVPEGMALDAGDRVTLCIGSRELLRGAGLAYGLPLLFMLVFVGIASLGGGPGADARAIPAAIAGLVAGIFLSRRILARDAACSHLVPVIDGHASAPES